MPESFPKSSALHRHLMRQIPPKVYDHPTFITLLPTATYKCELCDIVFDARLLGRFSHIGSLDHKRRVDKVRMMQSQPLAVQCSMVQVRIDALGLSSWREPLESLLYWFLMYQGNPPGITIARIEERLGKYEEMERTSLLELAVWKAICIANTDNVAVKDYHSWIEWLSEGWKSKKRTMRQTNEIVIIMTQVVFFLK